MAEFPAVFNLADLDGTNGFRISGKAGNDFIGSAVSLAGDINGDGFDDLIIGAHAADSPAADNGSAYVVFGKAAGFAANFNLSALDGKNGFEISGFRNTGFAVSASGDFNGDGIDDVIVAATYSDNPASYLVFGKTAGFVANLDLATLNGTNGFKIFNSTAGWEGNLSLDMAGDINGDGFDDLILGTPFADPNATYNSGITHVVFGGPGGFSSSFDLKDLDGSNGFNISGDQHDAVSGWSVASAGDINGDGFDDVLVGVPFEYSDNHSRRVDATYVVFGKASGFPADIKLSTLDGSDGFRMNGEDHSNYRTSRISVASAGDVNGDGYADLIIGDRTSNYLTVAYVVFGKSGSFGANLDLTSLDGANGFKISGESKSYFFHFWVAEAGDFNGDGFDDVLIGDDQVDSNGSNSGASYVIFGKATGFAANLDVSSLDGRNGFKILGEATRDQSGAGVSAAGDVNGDGYDDLAIGAPGADSGGADSGASYVIFGHASTGAAPDDFAVAENGSVSGDLFANNGHGADTVEPPNSLTITRVNGSAANVGVELALASGALITVEADGSFSYDTNGTFDDLPAPGSGASNATVYDTFTYRLADGSTATVRVTVSGLDTDDRVEGTDGADTLFAGKGDDRVFGLDGDDALTGGTGDDQIGGGAGNDVVEGGKGSDTLFGSTDIDTLSYAGSDARVIIDLATGTAAGGDAAGDTFSGFENVTGSDLNDLLTADSAANGFDGGDGVDSLSYATSGAGVTVNLRPHTNSGGDAEGDTILNIEDLIGSGFHDILRGDDNANRLTGSGGKDRLRGNLGSDVFDFNTLTDSGLPGTDRDRITDFTVNPSSTAAFIDRIDLFDIDSKAGTAGNQAFTFIGDAAFTAEGQIRAVQHADDTLVYVNTAGNKGAEMILILSDFAAADLTGADFVL